jgi:hypothetical protein
VVLNPHAVADSRDMGRRGVRDSVNGLVLVSKGLLPAEIVNPEVLERPGFRAKLARLAEREARRAAARGKSAAEG